MLPIPIWSEATIRCGMFSQNASPSRHPDSWRCSKRCGRPRGRAHGAHHTQCAYGPCNVLMALLEQPAASMPDILRIFFGQGLQNQDCPLAEEPDGPAFLEMEYEKFTPSYRIDAAAPIQNRWAPF